MIVLHRPRRAALAVTAGLLLAPALVACGGDGDTDAGSGGGSSDSSHLLPAAEGTTQYPVTVETTFGEVTVEERPERVVAGDDWEIDLLVALGVTPVGANDQDIFRAYGTRQLDHEIETTWSNEDQAYPAEPIATTEPELIVLSGVVEAPENLDALEAVAPTLGAPATGDELPAWEDRIRLLGEVLDLQERAEEVIQDNLDHFEQIRADHPEFADTTVAFLNFWSTDYGTGYLSTPGTGSTTLFEQLGFPENPDAPRFADVDVLSPELLGSIEADMILLNDASESADELETFLANPLFQSLEAVQEGRLVVVGNPGLDVTHDGEVISEGFGHFGRAIGGAGPVPQQALAELLVPLLAEPLAE